MIVREADAGIVDRVPFRRVLELRTDRPHRTPGWHHVQWYYEGASVPRSIARFRLFRFAADLPVADLSHHSSLGGNQPIYSHPDAWCSGAR